MAISWKSLGARKWRTVKPLAGEVSLARAGGSGDDAVFEVAEAGHFVQEWGAPIAEKAMAAFE